jgi:hypothetical protein
MKKRCTLAWALALSCVLAFGESAPVRVYTNEDLDRLSARRAETGELSRPVGAETTGSSPSARRGRGEDYWRKEAVRIGARVRTLEQEATHLREMIARSVETATRSGRSRSRSRGPSPTDANESRERRLRAALDRARELRADLEDRARRDGALPGWLR